MSVSLDNKGWSACPEWSYVASVYRSDCDLLHCIEKFRCCRMPPPGTNTKHYLDVGFLFPLYMRQNNTANNTKPKTRLKWQRIVPNTENYRRLHLPVNARAENMFSRNVKRLRFRRQTLKFSRPNVKFPRQSRCSRGSLSHEIWGKSAKIPSLIWRVEKASRTSSEKWMTIY